MLSVSNLACVRGDRRLFSGLAFSLEAGGRLHVGGENGAGKTSLLRILCGLSPAEEGEIRWQGKSLRELGDEYFQSVLYLGHHNALKEDLTALENLHISAALAGVRLSEGEDEGVDLLRRAGLLGREDLPVRCRRGRSVVSRWRACCAAGRRCGYSMSPLLRWMWRRWDGWQESSARMWPAAAWRY